MSIEIERRFLVKGNEWRNLAMDGKLLRQCYLSHAIDEWAVRIRVYEKQEAWITLKAPKNKIETHEFEYLIPIKDANQIWELSNQKIIKTRYELNFKFGNWIIDCFQEENAPLVIAEVELSSRSEKIVKPPWCLKEITGEYHWSNAALAETSITEWPIEQRLKANRKGKGSALL